MNNIVNLADLYQAVFQEPPSAMTRGSLIAMAHAFQITDNDPLGPDRDERITAARFDLFLISAFAVTCAGGGDGILKAFGGL